MQEQEYKIDFLKVVEKFGKPAKECNSVGIGDFTIYKFDKDGKEFPGFEDIAPGHIIKGKMYTNDKGYKTLYPPREAKTASGGGFRQAQAKELMAEKREGIQHFQDEKQYGIKVSSTFRAAHETAVAEWQENRRLSSTGPSIEDLFEKWRRYYWLNFEVSADQYPPLKD